MRLNPLTLNDKTLVTQYLKRRRRELSVYTFENMYIWRRLFEISWAHINDSLCVFFKDAFGYFLYLPPLSASLDMRAVDAAFEFMDGVNADKKVSRVENITESDAESFRGAGFRLRQKWDEYIFRREDLTSLRGGSFKSKRANCNYFEKHYRFRFSRYEPAMKDSVIRLYDRWMEARRQIHHEAMYRLMLGDGRLCLEVLLDDYAGLECDGGVVYVADEIRGFTFGFPVNSAMWCVLYEVADLSVKGLAQFIFREFCRRAAGFSEINAMDDSELANLRRVKLSYHPSRVVSGYAAVRCPKDSAQSN